MTIHKRIVCLANSRKLSGRCLAGREWYRTDRAGQWIRPVSARENQEISEYERQYEDGSDPDLLDIVTVPLLEHCPNRPETENWLIDDERYWTKDGTYPDHRLDELTDPVEPLWIDGVSTYHGKNDKVPHEATDAITASLRLIQVDQLKIDVFAPREAFGNSKRRAQAQFVHAGHEYALWIMDPAYERKYLRKLDGRYELGKCYLTISLGERYRDAYYKLVVGLIEAPS